MSINEWRMIFGINMEGVFFTFQSAVRHMMERGDGGSLVVTGSMSSNFGLPRGEHYAATKAGVVAIIRSLAVEYARHGIRANAILPGWIETDMTADFFKLQRVHEKVLSRVPQRRWGVPSDFGPIAVYFASDASIYHTGDAVIIDGGYSCF
jgi:NAD(P)-dependent dehydrogenase (short-subunit alcohol dehydrogenase family)